MHRCTNGAGISSRRWAETAPLPFAYSFSYDDDAALGGVPLTAVAANRTQRHLTAWGTSQPAPLIVACVLYRSQ